MRHINSNVRAVAALLVTALPLLAVLNAAGANLTSAAQDAILGTWHFTTPDGKTRVATIDVKSEAGKLAGAFTGYEYDKTDGEAGEKKVVAKLESPLIDPKFDGKALTFKVKIQPPRADMQPMEMEIELKLTGENEGETRIVGRPEAPALKATREVKEPTK
jgi:hypothetical protein